MGYGCAEAEKRENRFVGITLAGKVGKVELVPMKREKKFGSHIRPLKKGRKGLRTAQKLIKTMKTLWQEKVDRVGENKRHNMQRELPTGKYA